MMSYLAQRNVGGFIGDLMSTEVINEKAYFSLLMLHAEIKFLKPSVQMTNQCWITQQVTQEHTLQIKMMSSKPCCCSDNRSHISQVTAS